jgi:nitrogen fixation/metabolism regulation signal transduction histidine kinase
MTEHEPVLDASADAVVLAPSEKPNHDSWPWYRRRQYLIDRKGQLLATAKVAGVVFVLLVLVNLVFYLWSDIETEAIVASNPELAEEMADIDLRTTLVFAIVSFVVLVLVVIRTIMLTHRTAGAAFNLQRCLDRVASGDYSTVLRVRRKDNLRELQGPFNRMTASLRDRAADDGAALLRFAERIEELGHPEVARELRDLAKAKEVLAEPES